MNKHKYYEVIVAWAEGKPIQYRISVNDKWIDFDTKSLGWVATAISSLEWRIKPTTVKYRVALFKNEGGTWLSIQYDPSHLELEKQKQFVRWVTDWIEVEV